METNLNKDAEIIKFIALADENNIDIEKVKKYFQQQSIPTNQTIQVSNYDISKRNQEGNYDTREDHEGK